MTGNLIEGDTFTGRHYSWEEQSRLEEITSSGVVKFEEAKALIQQNLTILTDKNSTPEQKQEALARINEANETILGMYEECEPIMGESVQGFEDASTAYPDAKTNNEVEATNTALTEFKKNKALAELNISTVEEVLSTLNKGHEINSESVQYEVEPDGDYTITGEAIGSIVYETDLITAQETYEYMGHVIKHGNNYEINGPTEQEINDGR